MMTLAVTELYLGFTVGNRAVTINTRPIEEFRAWIANDRQLSLWPGELILSQKYFNSLLTHVVPLDSRALGALSHSALALDIYVFLARRLHEIGKASPVMAASLKKNQAEAACELVWRRCARRLACCNATFQMWI